MQADLVEFFFFRVWQVEEVVRDSASDQHNQKITELFALSNWKSFYNTTAV